MKILHDANRFAPSAPNLVDTPRVSLAGDADMHTSVAFDSHADASSQGPTRIICPVCRLVAEQWPLTATVHRIECDVCGEFRISDRAEGVIRQEGFPVSLESLREARRLVTPSEAVPFIDTPVILRVHERL
jgi:hypothetical protein